MSSLLSHQKLAIEVPKRFKTLVWHRRSRKTTTAIIELVRQSMRIKGVYWHVFPTYGEAKDAVWRDPNMLFNIVPPSFIKKRNETDLLLEMVNGSLIQLQSADNPASLLGSNPVGAVLDEFAQMNYEVWSRVLEPIVRANNGWVWFVGTPQGKNHLWKHYQMGLKENPEWWSSLMTADKSGIIEPKQLANAKESMTASLFSQEMMCNFLENEGTVFRGVREASCAHPLPPQTEHLYVAGVDLAKVTDWTVISIFDRRTNHQVYQDRFQTIEYPFQKKRIIEIMRAYNNARVIIDATGVGDPVADDLARSGLSIEPIKITPTFKKEMIEKLSIWIEQKRCAIIPLDESFREYDNFSYTIGASGTIRYQAREGEHDDIVTSHALAVYGLNPIYKVVESKTPSLLRQAYLQRIDESQSPEADYEW